MNYPESVSNQTTRRGTIGGMLLVLFNLQAGELMKTAILAATGALVSFLVSYALSELARRTRKKGGQA